MKGKQPVELSLNGYILSQALKCVDIDFTALYIIIVYRQTKSNSKFLGHIIDNLSQSLQLSNEVKKELFIATIRIYEHVFFDTVPMFKFHLFILSELIKDEKLTVDYISLMNGGLHFINRYENLTSDSVGSLVEMTKKFMTKMNIIVYDQIKAATYLTIQEFAKIINEDRNLQVLKIILNDCLGRQKIEELTSVRYRSMLYMIQAQICRLENNIPQSLVKLHEALRCCPTDDVTNAVICMLRDIYFHETIVQHLISDIRKMKIHFEHTGFITPLISLTDLPEMSVQSTGLRKTPRLNMIRKYERAIIRRMKNELLNAALSYIDLSMAVGDPTCIASNFLMASLYFYKLLQQTRDSSKAYAYRNVINNITVQVYLLSRRYLPPHMQIYMFKISFTLITRATEIFQTHIHATKKNPNNYHPHMLITRQIRTVLSELLKNMVNLVQVAPLHKLSLSRSYDLIYVEVVGQELFAKFLMAAIAKPNENLLSLHVYEYYLFEGVWRGWMQEKTFDEARFNCMQSLLSTKNWNMIDVQKQLQWSLLTRTHDGWLPERTFPLRLSKEKFARVHGISFYIETGEIKFLFQDAGSSMEGLFDAQDVLEVMRKGLVYGIFTLDQPNIEYPSHPFQEMRYGPSKLSDTHYLSTLLHADYLLKMLSTGTEVCSEPPFEMRQTVDGFLKRLPEWLKQELKPIDERKDSVIIDSVHRFWIEAGEITYEHTFDENNGVITYYLSDVPMCVKKQLMKYDEEGNLIDNTSKPDEDQTPEAEFARAFTKHYEEIGSYFPELLRLKELLKLGVLLIFIRSTFENIQKHMNNLDIEVTPINNFLQGIRNQLTYPCVTDNEINRLYNRILNENNIQSSAISYNETNELKNKIRTQLSEADETNLNKVTDVICESCHCSSDRYPVKQYVLNWLMHNNKTNLVNCIVNSLKTFKREKYSKILETIIYLGVNLDEQTKFSLDNSSTDCSWVPAVFCSKEKSHMKVYGGVNLQPNLKEGNVKNKNSDQIKQYDPQKVMNSADKPASSQIQSNGSSGKGAGQRRIVTTADNNDDGGSNRKQGWRKRDEGEKPYHHRTFGDQNEIPQIKENEYAACRTERQAFNMAKDQFGVARNAQPIFQTKVEETFKGKRTGYKLPLYGYFDMQGEQLYTHEGKTCRKIVLIRRDREHDYKDENPNGNQTAHSNAGEIFIPIGKCSSSKEMKAYVDALIQNSKLPKTFLKKHYFTQTP
ncbi:unnamed protein product [Didymodactylos carnosus]|uniref:Uncharacterized protein n=1 Tax=Didymodactylos carnosus TaxID=1234261 RepID=A0A8S2PLP2_9BILA|nr:unnamed protein product [Didymodactylos carnosus]CAF4055097.1 unnamed protein product [Didymodactylos carnosus]